MKRLVALFVLLAAAACSMPETKIYSLNMQPDQPGQAAARAASVAISVQSVRYLSQPYIAHRVSQHQLEISRYEKWESSPIDIIRDSFRDALVPSFKEVRVAQVPQANYHVLQVNLRRFEMTGASSAELAMDITVLNPDGRELSRRSIARQAPLDGPGYLGLAKAMSRMVAESVAEVKADLLKQIP